MFFSLWLVEHRRSSRNASGEVAIWRSLFFWSCVVSCSKYGLYEVECLSSVARDRHSSKYQECGCIQQMQLELLSEHNYSNEAPI